MEAGRDEADGREMSEFLEGLQFWHWLVAAFLLGIAEVLAPGAIFIWFAASAVVVGVLVMLLPGLGWQLQVIVFALLAFAAIALWRRYRRERPEVSDQPTLNQRGAQYVGQLCEVVDPIVNGVGRVRLGDTIWTVHGPDLAAGARVRVVAVEGAVLEVSPV